MAATDSRLVGVKEIAKRCFGAYSSDIRDHGTISRVDLNAAIRRAKPYLKDVWKRCHLDQLAYFSPIIVGAAIERQISKELCSLVDKSDPRVETYWRLYEPYDESAILVILFDDKPEYIPPEPSSSRRIIPSGGLRYSSFEGRFEIHKYLSTLYSADGKKVEENVSGHSTIMREADVEHREPPFAARPPDDIRQSFSLRFIHKSSKVMTIHFCFVDKSTRTHISSRFRIDRFRKLTGRFGGEPCRIDEIPMSFIEQEIDRIDLDPFGTWFDGKRIRMMERTYNSWLSRTHTIYFDRDMYAIKPNDSLYTIANFGYDSVFSMFVGMKDDDIDIIYRRLIQAPNTLIDGSPRITSPGRFVPFRTMDPPYAGVDEALKVSGLTNGDLYRCSSGRRYSSEIVDIFVSRITSFLASRGKLDILADYRYSNGCVDAGLKRFVFKSPADGQFTNILFDIICDAQIREEKAYLFYVFARYHQLSFDYATFIRSIKAEDYSHPMLKEIRDALRIGDHTADAISAIETGDKLYREKYRRPAMTIIERKNLLDHPFTIFFDAVLLEEDANLRQIYKDILMSLIEALDIIRREDRAAYVFAEMWNRLA